MSDHLLLFNYLIIKYFSYIIRNKTWHNMIEYPLFLNHPIQGTWYSAWHPDYVTSVMATGIQVIHAIHAFWLFLL